MSQQRGLPRDRPYNGRDSLDPDLLLIEERDRLRRGLLGRLVDNPLTPPEAILALWDEDWSLADRAHLRAYSRAWAAHGLLQKLLGEPQPSGRRKDRKGGRRSRSPATGRRTPARCCA